MNCDKPHRGLSRAIRPFTAAELVCVHSEFDIRSHIIGKGRRKMHPSRIVEFAETFA